MMDNLFFVIVLIPKDWNIQNMKLQNYMIVLSVFHKEFHVVKKFVSHKIDYWKNIFHILVNLRRYEKVT